MRISVVIPVYNAESFIEKAVKSALQFYEVKEVILIEDCSLDNSFQACKRLTEIDKRVILYQHPDKRNHGAAESMNLGLSTAKEEFVCILGADDFFLPNRFDIEKEKFKDSSVDGVYGAIGVHLYSETRENNNFLIDSLTTLNAQVNPDELKFVLINAHPKVQGYFSLDGLTIRRSLLDKTGFLNPILRLHQDTDFCLKLALKGNLVSGNIKEPIAMRGVHENNRITSVNNNSKSQWLLYSELLSWFNKNCSDETIKNVLVTNLNYFDFMKRENVGFFDFISLIFKNKYLFYMESKFNKALKRVVKNKSLASGTIKIKEKAVRILKLESKTLIKLE
jgi:glycosyltransferase involved in cell wall biosynthesis